MDYSKLVVEYSDNHYNSLDKPFFSGNICNLDISNSLDISSSFDVNILKNTYISSLPDEIKDFLGYFKISSRELYINEWTFMSIDKIIELCEYYKKHKITVIDIAIRYSGLGHVKVAFFDPKHNNINIRWDGGSNGYDREARFKELINYSNNKSLKLDSSSGPLLTFQDFIENIDKY